MESTLLSVGHGYAAARVTPALPAGWQALGSTRSPARAPALRDQGVAPVIWQAGGSTRALADALSQATHLITSVSPDEAGDPVLPVLAGLPAPRLRWLGYMSATSVYGDTGGDWLDETSQTNPTTARGRARLQAEQAWQQFGARQGLGVAVFRIAGIYGPGRSAIDQLRAGTARRVIKPGQVFNRIHVTDLGRIIAAAATQQATGPFNLCDEEPAPPQDVIAHAAALTGLPCPPDIPFHTADLSPMARSFYSESKRLRSVRVGPDLGVALRYPDYRAGLAGIAADAAT
ncbi:MAG: SDR family NAD(P)-dependent oxidoreductase [Pararhodobacter sp.]|nr:SDR family NAD(P)-dependent oxidoreductase [Pararhodobacter sp.]